MAMAVIKRSYEIYTNSLVKGSTINNIYDVNVKEKDIDEKN
jgi:hypothetical protein